MYHPFRFLLSATLILAVQATSALGEPFKFKLLAASAETYAHPHDIVLSNDGKRLYVADNGNHRIAVLDAVTLKELSTFGQGEVDEPHDVVFNAQEQLLVADTGNSRIAVYAIGGTGGRLVGQIRGRISRPEGVAVHPDGRVFATGAASGNLVVYRDGKVVGEVGGFSAPHDVEFAPDGGIWVADAGNDRMVRLNEKLEITQTLGRPDFDFNGPRYQDFDEAGRMFVADKYSNNVKVISTDGKLLQVLGKKASGKGEGIFNRPEGVEIRENEIWFADTYNDRIVRYRVTEGR